MRNEGSKLYSRQNLRRATVKNCWILTFSSLALFAITAPALGQSDGSIFVENGIRNPIEVSYALGGDTVRVTVSGKTTTRISPGPIQGGTEIALTLRRVDGDSAKRELPPAQVIHITVNNDITVRIIRFKLDGTLVFEVTEATSGTVVTSLSWGRIKTSNIDRHKVR